MPLIFLRSFSGLSGVVWSFKILFNSVSTEQIFGVQMAFESFTPQYRQYVTRKTEPLQMSAVWAEVTFQHEHRDHTLLHPSSIETILSYAY